MPEEVIDFDPQSLYAPMQELEDLEVTFTTEEVSFAVSQLANNKASGPDGLTNKFLKVYWDLLRVERCIIWHVDELRKNTTYAVISIISQLGTYFLNHN